MASASTTLAVLIDADNAQPAVVDAVVGPALRDLLERHPRLEPREPRADARVRPVGERDARRALAVDVEDARGFSCVRHGRAFG